MDSVFEILRGEHRRILEAADLALQVAARLERGETVPTGTLSALSNFFSYAVHRNHRDKEDNLLFPRLQDKGLKQGAGCVSALMAEHQEDADAFACMLAAAEAYEYGDRAAIRAWIDGARRYAAMLTSHIGQEEHVLFAEAERLLTPADQQELSAALADAEGRARFVGIDEVLEDLERVRQTLTATQLPRR